MGQLLDRLLSGAPVRQVHEPEGISLYPIAGHEADFDDLVRTIADRAGAEYVAFPRPAGPHHYDAVLVVGFDPITYRDGLERR